MNIIATDSKIGSEFDDPKLYLNRELSWLEFNRRVLEEGKDSSVPLLERLKFLAIFESNESVNEINFRHWIRGVSYQFHPESVGTEKHAIFFRDLVSFIL